MLIYGLCEMAYDVVPLCDMEMIEEKSVTLVYSP